MNYPLLIKLDVTLMAWNLDDVMWPLSDVFASRAPAEESGRGGHWMPNWCCRQCFRENIGLCCGVEQGSFNSIYHLVSGVWNTIVFLVQLGIAICCQWERFNPLTLVAELCALACQFGLDSVQRPKSGIQGRQ